jgi:hypothetical protein
MKYFWLAAFIVLVGCGGKSPSTNPSPSPKPTELSIQNQCISKNPCIEFKVYRIIGACPSTLANSSGWVLIGTTSENVFYDSSIISGMTYSYDVESVNGNSFSGPSNCQTRSVL